MLPAALAGRTAVQRAEKPHQPTPLRDAPGGLGEGADLGQSAGFGDQAICPPAGAAADGSGAVILPENGVIGEGLAGAHHALAGHALLQPIRG